MKKTIRLTESELTRLVKRILNESDKELNSINESAVLKYSNPLTAEISKSLDKKNNGKPRQNIFKVVTNNTTRYYSIVGNTFLTGRNELNFKDLVKKSNGDMVFNRYVKGGTDAETIPFKQMSKVLVDMSRGVKQINPYPGIYFNKVG